MSLSVARAWIRKIVRLPAAQATALQLIEQAAAERVDASLIVGSQLSTNGKCYLGRWDGTELVVLELSRGQQLGWNVVPKGLYTELHRTSMLVDNPITEPMVSLTDAEFDSPTSDGRTPLTGSCSFEVDAPQPFVENVALQAKYFRPDLSRTITVMWYADGPIVAPRGTLRFRLPPVASDENPDHPRGALVAFLQMFTADNWQARSRCRKISNVTTAVVTLQ